jgi:hypothetical protein
MDKEVGAYANGGMIKKKHLKPKKDDKLDMSENV